MYKKTYDSKLYPVHIDHQKFPPVNKDMDFLQ